MVVLRNSELLFEFRTKIEHQQYDIELTKFISHYKPETEKQVFFLTGTDEWGNELLRRRFRTSWLEKAPPPLPPGFLCVTSDTTACTQNIYDRFTHMGGYFSRVLSLSVGSGLKPFSSRPALTDLSTPPGSTRACWWTLISAESVLCKYVQSFWPSSICVPSRLFYRPASSAKVLWLLWEGLDGIKG